MALLHPCVGRSTLPVSGHFKRLYPLQQRSVWQQSLAHRACGCGRRLSRFQLRIRAARQRTSNPSPKRSAPERSWLQRQQQTQHTSDETQSQTTVHKNQQQQQQSVSRDPQRDKLVQQGFIIPNREPQSQAAPSGARANNAAADADSEDPLTESALLDDDMWDDLGDEPLSGKGSSSRGSRRKAIPPGEYFTIVKGPTTSGRTAQQSTSPTAAANAQAHVSPTGSNSHQTANAFGNASFKESRSSAGSSKGSKPRKSDSSSLGSKVGKNKAISSREMLFRQLASAPSGGSSSSSSNPVAEAAPDTSQVSKGRKSKGKARDNQAGQPEIDAATDSTIVASRAAPSPPNKGSSKARNRPHAQPETNAATVISTIVPDSHAADPSQSHAKSQIGSSKSKKKPSKQQDAITSADAHTSLADAMNDLSSSTEIRQEESGTHAEKRAPNSANGMTKTVRVGDDGSLSPTSADQGTADRLDHLRQVVGAINSNDAPRTAKGAGKAVKIQAGKAAGNSSKSKASISKASKTDAGRASAVDQSAAADAAAAVSAEMPASAAKQIEQSGPAAADAAADVSADKSASAAKQIEQSGAAAAVSPEKFASAVKQKKSKKPSSAGEPTPAAPLDRKKKRKQSTADTPPSSNSSADASTRVMSSSNASTSHGQPPTKADASARVMSNSNASTSYQQPSKAADSAVEEFLQAARAYRAERLRQRVLAGTKADAVLKKVEKKSKKADKAAIEAVRRHKRSVKGPGAEPVKSFEAARAVQKDCFPSLWVAPDVKAQSQPTYFVKLFMESGHLPNPTTGTKATHGGTLSLQINTCLVTATCIQDMQRFIQDMAPFFGMVNVSTAFHKMGKMVKDKEATCEQVTSHSSYAKLSERALHFVPNMKARQIGGVVWPLVLLRDSKNVILRPIHKRLLEMDVSTIGEAELSLVFWLFGRLQLGYFAEFMERAARDMLSRGVEKFSPQILSRVCWSFARNDLAVVDVLEALADYAAQHINEFPSLAMANMAWAFARMKLCHDGFMTAIPQALLAEHPTSTAECKKINLEFYKHQEVSSVVYAYAALGFYHLELLQAVEEEICKAERLEAFKRQLQMVVNILWSFATLRYYPTKWLSIASNMLRPNLLDISEQELSNIIWSFGRLGQHPGDMLQPMLDVVDTQVSSGATSLQGCGNVLWALGVFGAANNPIAARILQYMSKYSYIESNPQNHACLHQIFQALLVARTEASRNQEECVLKVPTHLQYAALRSWKVMMQNPIVSSFHQEVSDVLTAMSVEHKVEHVTEDELFSVDVAIVEARIAIEVDGPWHYTLNTNQPLGHTILRRRLLTALGWSVSSVPYFDWDSKVNGPDKARYLADILRQYNYQLPPNYMDKLEQMHQHNSEADYGTKSRLGWVKGTFAGRLTNPTDLGSPADMVSEPSSASAAKSANVVSEPSTAPVAQAADSMSEPSNTPAANVADSTPEPTVPPSAGRRSKGKPSSLRPLRRQLLRLRTELPIDKINKFRLRRSANTDPEILDRNRAAAEQSVSTAGAVETPIPAELPDARSSAEVDKRQPVQYAEPSSSPSLDSFEVKTKPISFDTPSRRQTAAEPSANGGSVRGAVDTAWASHGASDWVSSAQEVADRQRRSAHDAARFSGRAPTSAEVLRQTVPHRTASGTAAQSAASPRPARADRIDQLQEMTLIQQLRPLCKQYGLPVGGVKHIVINRILKHERGL